MNAHMQRLRGLWWRRRANPCLCISRWRRLATCARLMKSSAASCLSFVRESSQCTSTRQQEFSMCDSTIQLMQATSRRWQNVKLQITSGVQHVPTCRLAH